MTNTTASTADRLLDAQVAWVLDELTGDTLHELLARDVDEVLAGAAAVPLSAVASVPVVMAVADLLLARVPGSAVVADLVEMTADQLHTGPDTPVVPGEHLHRSLVEELVDASMAARPLVGQALDQLAESPMMGALASRFITRLVVDVLEANKSLTKKIPGVRTIVSAGTSAATKMVGVADKQVQALLGDSAGKGTAIAVRRLNSVIMATLQDDNLRGAAMEAWDAFAREPFDGIGDVVSREDHRRIGSALRDIVASGAITPPVRSFLEAWVKGLFDRYGDTPVAEVLADLGITRDDVVAVTSAVVPPLVAAAAADGRLEQAVRSRLEPFFLSPAVAAILAG